MPDQPTVRTTRFKNMKIYYDEETDAAYINLSEEKPSGVIEISEGVNLDMTEDGKF